MYFYEILKDIMEQKNLKVADVARLCNLSDSTVRSIFTRKQKTVALDVAFKLSDGLQVPLKLLNGICNSVSSKDTLILSDIEKQLVIAYRNHIDMQPAINKMLDITDDSDNIVNKPKQKKIEPQKIISFAARNGKGGTIELNDEQAEKLQNVLESDFPELL